MMARVGRPQQRQLVLNESEQDELERMTRSHSGPHGLVRWAQIILASANGEVNTAIASGRRVQPDGLSLTQENRHPRHGGL